MEVAGLILAGGTTFTCLYITIKKLLIMSYSHEIQISSLCDISLKIVSAAQAITSFVIGRVIVNSCQNDIMTDRHWLTNSYACFALPYFLYDIFAMYEVHYHKSPQIHKKPLIDGISDFMRRNIPMMIHHICLPLIFYPAIIFFRRGLGDFFVGIFYQIELAVPFIVFRGALAELNMKNSSLYIIAGLAMIAVFAVTRVLVFPYLYWKYSIHANIPFQSVVWSIPIKCNLGCLILVSLQIYWLSIMVRGAYRVFYKMWKRYSSKQIID